MKTRFCTGGFYVYPTAIQAPNRELLVVVTPKFNKKALKIYRKRWETEKTKEKLSQPNHMKEKVIATVNVCEKHSQSPRPQNSNMLYRAVVFYREKLPRESSRNNFFFILSF